jgi:hypothetical protein
LIVHPSREIIPDLMAGATGSAISGPDRPPVRTGRFLAIIREIYNRTV